MTLGNRIRARLRRHVPERWRRLIAQARRRAGDARSSAKFEFSDECVEQRDFADFVCAVDISQPIRQTAHYEGKLHNIDLAVGRLNHLCLRGRQAVSFWQRVGMPTAANGFRLGRGIVGDRLSPDIGGGLCQIASLLYELGLRAGMTVLERHPHSRDLYTEVNRFTPLGLDATVVWGFKDVRLANVHTHAVIFDFSVDGSVLRGRLLSEEPLRALDLETSRRDEGQKRIAEVRSRDLDGKTFLVSRDSYVIDPS
jgi:vancomycin resistance protein VanW